MDPNDDQTTPESEDEPTQPNLELTLGDPPVVEEVVTEPLDTAEQWRDPTLPSPRYLYYHPNAAGRVSFALDYMPPPGARFDLSRCWLIERVNTANGEEVKFRRPRRSEPLWCAHTGLMIGFPQARHVLDTQEAGA